LGTNFRRKNAPLGKRTGARKIQILEAEVLCWLLTTVKTALGAQQSDERFQIWEVEGPS
jgi:hypothetical protein